MTEILCTLTPSIFLNQETPYPGFTNGSARFSPLGLRNRFGSTTAVGDFTADDEQWGVRRHRRCGSAGAGEGGAAAAEDPDDSVFLPPAFRPVPPPPRIGIPMPGFPAAPAPPPPMGHQSTTLPWDRRFPVRGGGRPAEATTLSAVGGGGFQSPFAERLFGPLDRGPPLESLHEVFLGIC